MLGAVIGDIVGSRFEADNHKSKEFDLFTQNSCPTDDSIMTLAVAKALLASKEDWSQLSKNSVKYMQKVGRHYPNCGYGGHFSIGFFLRILNPMVVMVMAPLCALVLSVLRQKV